VGEFEKRPRTSRSAGWLTRRIAWTLLVALPIAVTATAAAQDRSASLRGHWHVDLERSSNPYTSNTKSVTLDIITDDGKMYESEETVVKSDGTTRIESVRVPVDGIFYPVRGSFSGVSVAVTHWAPGSIRVELRTPDGLRGLEVCTLSADFGTIVCEETDTDSQGRETFAETVYVRG
jgi:hypothetical protein